MLMSYAIIKFLTAVVVGAALILWRGAAQKGSKSKSAAEIVTTIMVCYGVSALFDAAVAALIGS